MAPRTSTVVTAASITVLGGLVAYAIYFDHKRRNDAEFRKQLRKEKKRVDKTAAAVSSSTATPGPSEIKPEDLRRALEKLQQEELPTGPDEREHYFMTQVENGERLAMQGPIYTLPAAMAFFQAMRVYPSPVELIMIYQKTVPEPVFKVVMDLTNLDVSPPSSGGVDVAPSHAGREEEEEETSPSRSDPPSETSSQEWDRLTDPGVATPAP